LTTTRGAVLFRQAWTPADEPAAVLAVMHGYGEHGGRYRLLADGLVPRGYAVHTVDLPGHGRSPGRRGHINRFAEYVAVSRALVAALRREYPQTPLFLLGHSLGGLIAAVHAEEGDANLSGVVLSSPLIRLGLHVSPAKLAGLKVLCHVLPSANIGNPLRAADLSHDSGVVVEYEIDKFNHHVATARWGSEVLAAQRLALAGAARLRLPLLLQYAGADVIADPQASEQLFAAAGSADKTRRRYDDYFHEIYNEAGRQEVYDDLLTWLAARLTTAR
jgi:alpha-beta hydrolase superfamily lysophospholipase